MHRFFVPPEWLRGESVSLEGPVAHQLARVLRAQPGQRIVLLDNSGLEYEVELTRVAARTAEGRVLARRPGVPEPEVSVHLYQGALKGEKLDWVLQKGTELGVRSFTITHCARSVTREARLARLERWRRIVTEAAEQCGRSRLPGLRSPLPLGQALAEAPGVKLLLWEAERATGLADALARHGGAAAFSLFTGPEGGFEEGEVEEARRSDAEVVTLGRRTLRAETASIVATTLVLHHAGELGGR